MTNIDRAAKIIKDTLGVLTISAENTAYKLAKDGLLAEEARIVRAIEAIDRAAVDAPEVKPGDRVTFDALGRKAVGTVTRWDDDGITIEEVKNDAPPRPTLADMTPEEQAACKGMQADLAQGDRVVILDGHPGLAGRVRVLEASLDTFRPTPGEVTPRPDLPRLGWPTNRTTRAADDQPADDQPVAEGSAWSDAEELRRACVASNLDHITVTDKNGDAAQWFGKIAYWQPAGPRQPTAPFTVTHTSKRDEK